MTTDLPRPRRRRITEQERDPYSVSAIAGALRAWRRAAGLTQAQVAAGLGIRSTLYATYERGITVPPATLLRRIVLLWGADPAALLDVGAGTVRRDR